MLIMLSYLQFWLMTISEIVATFQLFGKFDSCKLVQVVEELWKDFGSLEECLYLSFVACVLDMLKSDSNELNEISRDVEDSGVCVVAVNGDGVGWSEFSLELESDLFPANGNCRTGAGCRGTPRGLFLDGGVLTDLPLTACGGPVCSSLPIFNSLLTLF